MLGKVYRIFGYNIIIQKQYVAHTTPEKLPRKMQKYENNKSIADVIEKQKREYSERIKNIIRFVLDGVQYRLEKDVDYYYSRFFW
jgi:predicted transcriptional regulator